MAAPPPEFFSFTKGKERAWVQSTCARPLASLPEQSIVLEGVLLRLHLQGTHLHTLAIKLDIHATPKPREDG
ncbi:hypothetical protein Cob_v005923 [Colletotrichum orbiculare MAFF 240422]|uniref:Uncharacterized protein n=1 Tax=Colletotrichum orbiculare (strain 104-T / ATCC 96160 / CBS 514.97 / LARS 414 / MAFF 240422) TaxID=1213857 RepID=A0A484FSZ2_COLOR|nr:hypothetical protein Cob_v005923 [Colletotrichum orbiculare MAFF 240422]